MAVVIRLTECRIVKSMEVQGNQTIILAVLWGWLLLPSQTIRFSFFQMNIIFTVIFLNQKNIKDFYATSVFSLPHVWVLCLEQQRVFPSKLLHIKLNSWEVITEWYLALLKAVPPTICFQYSSFGKSLCFLPLPGSLYAKAWRPVIHWLFWIRRFREIPWIWKGFEWLRAACICSLNFTWKHWSLSGGGRAWLLLAESKWSDHTVDFILKGPWEALCSVSWKHWPNQLLPSWRSRISCNNTRKTVLWKQWN